jgi:hypothetical protein
VVMVRAFLMVLCLATSSAAFKVSLCMVA